MCLRPLLVVLSHLNILSQPGFKEIPCKVITTPAAVSQSPVDLISYLQSTVLLEIVVTLNFSVYMLNNKTYLDMGGGGQAVAQLVNAMRYKPEGHGFDSRLCHWSFSLIILLLAPWPWSRVGN